MPIVPLQCPVQHYAWGSTTSIPALLDKKNPEERPWAELWMGAHPKACSLVGEETLQTYLKTRNAPPLPFLFKILAAETSLSIQCHPNRSQAQAGFAHEESLGIAIDAPSRNYKDTNHKPELIVALTTFSAMKGFREPNEILALLDTAEITALAPLAASLSLPGGLQAFFTGLLALEPSLRKTSLEQLRRGADRLPALEAKWTKRLLKQYPDDIGAIAPLFLRVIELSAGQALFLGPGELHAYLQGTGLEIMASSDNVLRGGLTPKHVDPAELTRVLQFVPSDAEILSPTRQSTGLSSYTTTCPDFSLGYCDVEATPQEITSRGAAILLALGGSVNLQWGEQNLRLAPGEVAFCTRDVASFTAAGNGRLWVASSGS